MIGVYYCEPEDEGEDDETCCEEEERDTSIGGGGFSSWSDFWRYKEG